MTVYLKFPNEATAQSVLADYHGDEGWITASHTHALDVVGTIHKPTGVMLQGDNGMEFPEMVALDGFHVNFIGTLPAAAQAYVVTPSTPSRMFA